MPPHSLVGSHPPPAAHTVPVPPVDPRHLDEDDLQIECRVRSISGRQSFSVKQLHELMMSEDAGRLERPKMPHPETNAAQEMSDCQTAMTKLYQRLKECRQTPNADSIVVLQSRAGHLARRIERFAAVCPPCSELTELRNQMGAVLQEIQQRRR